MKLFETVETYTDGEHVLYRPGKDIYAMDKQHAELALIHHGLVGVSLVSFQELEWVHSHKKVQWDSLLYPSKLQLN